MDDATDDDLTGLTDDDMKALVHEVASVDVPEPSPLFWDHFNARVREAIDAPPPSPRRWWRTRWLVVSAAAATVLALCLIGVYQHRRAIDVAPADPVAYGEAPAVSGPFEVPDADADEAWAVVRSLAADLDYDEAHDAGVVPRPEAIEGAATELPADERAELLRLIEADMKRTGA